MVNVVHIYEMVNGRPEILTAYVNDKVYLFRFSHLGEDGERWYKEDTGLLYFSDEEFDFDDAFENGDWE